MKAEERMNLCNPADRDGGIETGVGGGGSFHFLFHFWISGNEPKTDRNQEVQPLKTCEAALRWLKSGTTVKIEIGVNEQQAEGPRANKLSSSLQTKHEATISAQHRAYELTRRNVNFPGDKEHYAKDTLHKRGRH